MSDSNELMLNRLLVIVQIILIPVYFIYFAVNWHDKLLLFFDNLLENANWLSPVLPHWMVVFLANYGIPIFFSLPWVLASILRATRIADAYTLMGRALGKVRIDQKLFYGLNAAFTLVFFVLPFGSPIITIIGIFVVMRMVMRKLLIGKFSKLSWIIPSLIISFYPSLIVIAFYINYIELMQVIMITWTSNIGAIFGIGLCLAISISLGNFFLFLFEGRSKFGSGEEVNEGLVLLLKAIFFSVFLMLYFSDGEQVVNIVNYIAVALAFFEMIVRRMKDMDSDSNTTKGIVMVIIFSIVNMMLKYLETIPNAKEFVQSLVIIVSGLIFFVLFILSYRYATDPELL